MIFITLGSQKFQFNRLLEAIDEQVANGKIEDLIFAQIGASDYKPQHYEYKNFLDRKDFYYILSKADIVITHGGTGAIMGAIKKGKKVIAIPRLAKYGEHVDDHQLQLIKHLNELGLIIMCQDCGEIYKKIEETKKLKINTFLSNTQKITENIEEFIENNKQE